MARRILCFILAVLSISSLCVPAAADEPPPELTAAPEETAVPASTLDPEQPPDPELMADPEQPLDPEPTADPEPTLTPEPTPTSEPTAAPEPAIESTEPPEMTEAPVVTDAPETVSVQADSGVGPDGLAWAYSSGMLTISGTGVMQDYSNARPDWDSFSADVAQIIIGEGVASVSAHAFDGYANLYQVTIPSSVTSIGSGAFASCAALSGVTVFDPACALCDGAGTLGPLSAVIYGYPGSTAQAYAEKYGYTFCSLTGASTLDAPARPAAAQVYGGIQIRWEPVDGAAMYRVLYRTDGDWSALADTDGVSYTWSGPKSGVTYAFTVCCLSADGGRVVSKYDGTGCAVRYQPSSKTLAAPKLTSVSAAANGVKIAWNAVSGAAQYRVFYKTGSGKWKKLADAAGASYTWTGAQSGKTYAFTVRCLAADGKSYASEYDAKGKSLQYIAAPRLETLSAAASGVKLAWSAPAGAAMYRVFYKTGSSKWKKLADTADTGYTWTGAQSGETYAFTVRCISKNGKSYTSAYDTAGRTLQFIAMPKLSKVSATASGVKIAWKAVPGAAKYRVFYKTGSGKWKKLKDTAGTGYTWTKAQSGKTYAFTVRCLSENGRNYTSAYDAKGKSLNYIAAPKLTGVTDSGGQLTVAWRSSAGAAMYRVFYKTGSGKWEKLADTADTNYTWTGAALDKEYAFTVRCLSKSGKSYTSAYDKTGKSVRTAKQYLTNGLPATDKNVRDIIYALREQYPDGTIWDGSSTYYSPWLKMSGGGCYGFALLCSDAAFGGAPMRTHTSFDDIRPGDILRVNYGRHSVVVLEKTDEAVSVVEGNYDGCVSWGRAITRQQLETGGLVVTTRYTQ